MNGMLRILMAEDSPDDAQLILLQLEQEGLEIDYRRVDTEAAFRAALDSPPDLILSDFAMPQFSGLQALRIVRERELNIPFILISGTIGEEIAVEAMKLGADDYLMKDRLGRLGSAIQGVLNKKQLGEEKARADIAVRNSEARFRSLIENSSDEVSIVAADGSLLYESPSSNPTLGYRSGEFLDKNLFQLVHPDDLERVQNQFAQLLQDPNYHPRDRFRLLHQDGTWRWVEAVGTNLLHEPAVGGIVVNYHDVTERVQVEARLQASESRYRLATRATNDVIWEWDPQTNQLTWAENAQFVFGYLSEDIGPDALWWDAHIHPEDRQRVLSKLDEVTRGNELVWQDEYRFLLKDGSYATISDHAYIERDFSGQALRLIGAMSNITNRKEAEKRIQRQLQQLSALRAIDIAISSTFDMKTSLNVLLDKVRSQLGASAACVLIFDRPTHMLEYIAGNGFTSSLIQQTRLRIGDGLAGRAALERHAVHIPDLAQADDPSWRTRLPLGEAFKAYYATPLIAKGDLKGVLEIFHHTDLQPDAEWLEFLDALTGQAAIAIDNAQLFENLQRAKTELEHRVAERTAELHRMNIELESANRAKDEFLASMSHELRTPLNSIIGLSESLLEQRIDSLSGQQQRSMQVIAASGHHLLDLITDILDLSKIEVGKFEYRPQLVLVDDLCRSSLAFINNQAVKKSIAIRYENNTSIVSISADPRRLKQILINLLSNAVKFTQENGQVTLHVNTNPVQDRIEFSVIDTGIGIAQEDLNRLFQPFVQLDSSLSRQYDGTGLGLTLVQKLTDLHGGSVEVESEPGKGSRFTIFLPLDLAFTEQDLGDNPKGKIQRGEQREKGSDVLQELPARAKILIAEDNAANILTIGDYLESHGYEISVAHDGLEALEKADALQPDMILMDVQMPTMNGLEAMTRLRANSHFATTPIIALTALAMPGDRERCLRAGASEYMSKPVSLKMLLKTVETLLGNHKR
jgi:PAS domain S-box-containing protein